MSVVGTKIIEPTKRASVRNIDAMFFFTASSATTTTAAIITMSMQTYALKALSHSSSERV
jgi:hypothetical protein